MVYPVKSREFMGRFGITYIDGEMIYAYDEITHGLYKFTLDAKEVTLVLSPERINRNSWNRVQGISKKDDEIILIPLCLNSEWIFYDVIKESVRYDFPVKDKIRISSAVTVDTKIFLIPSKSSSPIMIVSLLNMEEIKTYNDWYSQRGVEYPIWGASLYNGFVFFPIVNTNHICCLNDNELNIITLSMNCSITSVSIGEDQMWVLPGSGAYIYTTNLKGEITEKIDLSKTGYDISADRFNKVVYVEEHVFLLPASGGNIYVYQYKEKKMVEIRVEEEPLWGEIFVQNATPYWDFIIENKRIHLMPSDYAYRSIDIPSLWTDNHSLSYGENINSVKYWKMVRDARKDTIFGEQNNLLEFIQMLFLPYDGQDAESVVKAGEKIWKKIS